MLTEQGPLLSTKHVLVTKGRGTPSCINMQFLITMSDIKEFRPDSAASVLYLLTQPKMPPRSGNISLRLPIELSIIRGKLCLKCHPPPVLIYSPAPPAVTQPGEPYTK